MNRSYSLIERAVALELSFCQQVNRKLGSRLIQSSFAIISRLGDGIFWYSLMICLPLLYGSAGLQVSATMFVVGVVNLSIYKVLKKKTSRARPCAASDLITLGAQPLDLYSFPSGHTLHAVAFSIILVSYYPFMGWVVIPFAALVAMSRVILGLHYPTDVLAGAAIGTTTAILALTF
jgi:undecaprenyl-diphosphatase